MQIKKKTIDLKARWLKRGHLFLCFFLRQWSVAFFHSCRLQHSFSSASTRSELIGRNKLKALSVVLFQVYKFRNEALSNADHTTRSNSWRFWYARLFSRFAKHWHEYYTAWQSPYFLLLFNPPPDFFPFSFKSAFSYNMRRVGLLRFLGIAWFSSSVPRAIGTQPCWLPNGSSAPTSLPCNSTQTESACCMNGMTCLSNGVCQLNQDLTDTNWPIGTMWRGSCTDRSWQSSDCPLFCYSECMPYYNDGKISWQWCFRGSVWR